MVFFDEVITGLVRSLPPIVTVLNTQGQSVQVPCFPYRPEKEFVPQQFPAMTLFPYDARLARDRTNSSPDFRIDRVLGTARESEFIPIDMYIQLDFWAQFFTDMSRMISLFYSRFTERGLLSVTDSLGRAVSIGVYRQGSMATLDSHAGDLRYFRRAFTLVCWGYTEHEVGATRLVQRRVIRVQGDGEHEI